MNEETTKTIQEAVKKIREERGVKEVEIIVLDDRVIYEINPED